MKDSFKKLARVKKGFDKKRKLIAAGLLFGRLKTDSDKIQTHKPVTPLAHEKVISNQELNTLEDSHNSDITVQTGNGIIFALKQKADDSSFNEEFYLLDQDDQLLILAGIGEKPLFFKG